MIEKLNNCKRSKKILYISTPLSWRGGEQQLTYLLEELQKKSLDFALLCPENSVLKKVSIEKGFKFFTFKSRGLLNISLGKKAKRICKKYGYNIVHANDSHSHTAAVAASLLGARISIVLSRRVDFPVKNNMLSIRKYNWPAIKAIVCVSKFVKEVLSSAIRNKNLLKVIYSGIDLRRFDISEQSFNLKKKFNIPDNYVVVGMVAALAPHKDYPTYIKAAAETLKHNKNIMFLGVGEGGERELIESLIKEKKIESNFILTGFIEDIPSLIMQLDFFMLTSETEGLGTSVLDAFACGLPVIATKAGGIPEIVLHEKTGMISPVKDYNNLSKNLLQLINDDELKKNLGGYALEYVKQFTKENMAKQYIGLYNDID